MLQFKVGRKKKPKLSLKQLFCEFISFNAVIAVDIKLSTTDNYGNICYNDIGQQVQGMTALLSNGCPFWSNISSCSWKIYSSLKCGFEVCCLNYRTFFSEKIRWVYLVKPVVNLNSKIHWRDRDKFLILFNYFHIN